MVRVELATPGLQTQCSSHWATRAQKLLLGRSWVYPVGVLHHYIFIISQLWLTSHQRSIVVLLDTETPGTSREIYSEDADGETRTRNPGLQTQCSSHWATRAQKLLLGRSWVYPVGVLHHYIFIISQLWLTSHQRSTVVLLDTAQPLDYEFESHHRHPHCKFLYWYQEFLCPVEPLYFSDEKSTTVEKW